MQPSLKNKSASKPVAIGYLIDHFLPGGGTELQLATLVNNLDRNQFSPMVIVLQTKKRDLSADFDCPVEYLGVSSLLSLDGLRGLLRLIRLIKRHRLSVLQIFFIDSNLIGVLAARLAGLKKIIVSRRDMGWWHGSRSHRWSNRINRMVDHCLANSEAVKKAVVNNEPFAENQVRVIKNGINRPTPQPETNATANLGIDNHMKLVTIVANLKPIKQVDIFIRAAALINEKNIRFLLLGDGRQKDQLADLAADLGISDKVIFHHTIGAVFDFLDHTDVGVLTSETEGLSNALIEYALAGVPAVAFDTGGNSEVIEDGVTGFLVEPYNETVLAEQISRILEDDNLRAKMSRAAAHNARKNFSVLKMVADTQDYYRNILSCD
ncbi:MAG: glycosyltransferase [candidate division Zixibacteria bacterium]